MVNIQFKFGDTWQNQYLIGDLIRWGGADIGMPGLDKVKVYGISELDKCPSCQQPIFDEYEIIVEKDIIKYINPIFNLEDYDSNDGNYVIPVQS